MESRKQAEHSQNKAHVVHEVQHSAENRNPYEDLVAKTEGLPIVHIMKAASPKQGEISELLKSGIIQQGEKKLAITLPLLFVLGAAETCAELGGDNTAISFRTTVASLTTIPHAPKPANSKLKTGKSGMSRGVIPVDLTATTHFDDKNNVIALKQNEKYIPKIDGDIVTTQFAKPLEQILMGLSKDPSEFKLHNSSEDIKKTGYLEVTLTTPDAMLNQVIYRVNLQDTALVKPLDIDSGRKSAVEQPQWWDANKFGNFSEKVKSGYPVEYKKFDAAEFKAYDVYARTDSQGNKLPLTGDQDFFCIPRSSKYDLGELAREVIDTHAPGGTTQLISRLLDVYQKILIEDLFDPRENDTTELVAKVYEKTVAFYQRLNSSQNYIEALGTITPYEAYFIIYLNDKVAELTDALKDKPDELMKRIEGVEVTSTIGIEKMPYSDIDIHPAWFKENPQHCSVRIEEQLKSGNYVAPDILLLYISHIEKEHIDAVGIAKAEQPTHSVGYFQSSREKKSNDTPLKGVAKDSLATQIGSQLDTVMKSNPDCEIYIKIDNKFAKFTSDMDVKKMEDILIITKENRQKQVLHVRGNKINSSVADKQQGYIHIKGILEATNISINESIYPTHHNGRIGDIKEMHAMMSKASNVKFVLH